jgi:hypothetical protein
MGVHVNGRRGGKIGALSCTSYCARAIDLSENRDRIFFSMQNIRVDPHRRLRGTNEMSTLNQMRIVMLAGLIGAAVANNGWWGFQAFLLLVMSCRDDHR